MKPVLSIGIVNWDTGELLQKCLESVYVHTKKVPFEVWVVDNNSGDGTAEMIKNQFPAVQLICNQENLGQAKGDNQILKRYQGDYFLMLDPDIILVEDTFSKMVHFLQERNNDGIVGCRFYFPNGVAQASVGPFPSVLDYLVRLYQNLRLPKTPWTHRYAVEYWDYSHTNILDGGYPSGACLLIPREVIDIVGLMDEHFSPAYLEETDWCYRIRKAEFKLYYYADTYVLHWLGSTIRKLSETEQRRIQYIWKINYHYFLLKHETVLSRSLVRVIGAMESIGFGLGRLGCVLIGRAEPSSLKRDLIAFKIALGSVRTAEELRV